MKNLLIVAALFFHSAAYSQVLVDKGQADALRNFDNCNSGINAVLATSLGKEARSQTVFNQNGGTFDPVPLLSATVTVKEASCVVIHFSANTYVADNSVIYQVRMDGKPVEGHLTSVLPAIGNNSQPIMIVPDEDGHATKAYHPVSYTFYSKAAAGNHKIEVMKAVCCSANAGTSPVVVADNATLIVQYFK